MGASQQQSELILESRRTFQKIPILEQMFLHLPSHHFRPWGAEFYGTHEQLYFAAFFQ